MSEEYEKGYLDGVLAERKRAVLVALRATAPSGKPSTEGHSLAQQIAKAGNRLPREVPGLSDEWSVFGERRIYRDLPTFLEGNNMGLTKRGERLALRDGLRLSRYTDAKLREKLAEKTERVKELEHQLKELDRVKDLEHLVETLTRQLTGTIG